MPFCPRLFRAAVFSLLLVVPIAVPIGLGGAESDRLPTARLPQSRLGSGTDDVFATTSPLRIAIDIPEVGIEALRRSGPSPTADARPAAEATILEGGREYLAVSVRLKGFSTFQPINRTPSLTLNFDTHVPTQTFHGLEKISLNNSAQDPSRLQEAFSRAVFAAAGVPVPRSAFALVTLNGRALGLYVLTEGFDKRFLEHHFARTDGNLYEGGALKDITAGLQLVTGKNPQSAAAVDRLIRAAREPDPEARFRALSATLDLDRFLSMVAVETMLCHSDSYSMNRNNYRVYHDPRTDKIVFMPHGIDRILGGHRSALDLSIVPPRLGLVARALLSTAEGRRRYVDRVATLLEEVFRPDALCRRAREIDSTTGAEAQAANLCARIATRASELAFQMEDRAELAQLVASPAFDTTGLARIAGWRPAPKLGQARTSFGAVERNGRERLHLQATASPVVTSLRTRFSLPAGRYRITGRVTAVGAEASSEAIPVSVSLVRVTPSRFAYERRPLGGGDIDATFQVSESVSPEEIELTCDVKSQTSDAWIDAGSLTLVRLSD